MFATEDDVRVLRPPTKTEFKFILLLFSNLLTMSDVLILKTDYDLKSKFIIAEHQDIIDQIAATLRWLINTTTSSKFHIFALVVTIITLVAVKIEISKLRRSEAHESDRSN